MNLCCLAYISSLIQKTLFLISISHFQTKMSNHLLGCSVSFECYLVNLKHIMFIAKYFE